MEVKTRIDPMANYKLLTEEERSIVDKAIAEVSELLGGKDVSLKMVAGFADAFRPISKLARDNAGVNSKNPIRNARMLDDAAAKKVSKYLREGDTISYLLKSKMVTFENLRVEKLTGKRIQVRINGETSSVYMHTRKHAEDFHLDLSYGVKYVNFNAVQLINGMDVYDFIAAKEK